MSYRHKMYHSIVLFVILICITSRAEAHPELYYSYTIKSVNQTKNNLIIKGTISIPIKKYSGEVFPVFMITGIKNKPLITPCVEAVNPKKPYRSNGEIHIDFVLDMLRDLKRLLPENGVGLKFIPRVAIPDKGKYIKHHNAHAGENNPIAEASYTGGGSIFVYLRIRPLLSGDKVPRAEIINQPDN